MTVHAIEKTNKPFTHSHLLTLAEYSQQDVLDILALAAEFKANPASFSDVLAQKSVAMIFEKPSLRTRVSFDVGINKLGGHAVYLDQQNGAFGKRETVKDFAENLSCWCSAIVARVFKQTDLEELAKYSKVPVINALSDLYHPCQGLADYLTLQEQFGELKGLKLAYIGDGNNVVHSLMFGGALLGVNLTVITPKGYEADSGMVEQAKAIAAKHGGSINVTTDMAAIEGQQAVYTDTWVSMGDDTPLDQIKQTFGDYQVNQTELDKTDNAIFMHCQPAHRGYEVTSEVMDGEKSVVMQQAENRMHVQNAVLLKLLA